MSSSPSVRGRPQNKSVQLVFARVFFLTIVSPSRLLPKAATYLLWALYRLPGIQANSLTQTRKHRLSRLPNQGIQTRLLTSHVVLHHPDILFCRPDLRKKRLWPADGATVTRTVWDFDRGRARKHPECAPSKCCEYPYLYLILHTTCNGY